MKEQLIAIAYDADAPMDQRYDAARMLQQMMREVRA